MSTEEDAIISILELEMTPEMESVLSMLGFDDYVKKRKLWQKLNNE